MNVKELIEELRALDPDTEMIAGLTYGQVINALRLLDPYDEVQVRNGNTIYTLEKKETLQ